MDGENSGKSYEKMDDLGVFHPYVWEIPICFEDNDFPSSLSQAAQGKFRWKIR